MEVDDNIRASLQAGAKFLLKTKVAEKNGDTRRESLTSRTRTTWPRTSQRRNRRARRSVAEGHDREFQAVILAKRRWLISMLHLTNQTVDAPSFMFISHMQILVPNTPSQLAYLRGLYVILETIDSRASPSGSVTHFANILGTPGSHLHSVCYTGDAYNRYGRTACVAANSGRRGLGGASKGRTHCGRHHHRPGHSVSLRLQGALLAGLCCRICLRTWFLVMDGLLESGTS